MTVSISVRSKESLLEALIRKKIRIDHSCGGMGSCGTCRVLVQDPEKLHKRNSVEQTMADDRGFEDKERLACQTHPDGSEMIIEIPENCNPKQKY